MELASMGRRLALLSAGCALALGLSAGFAAQQAQALYLWDDYDGCEPVSLGLAEGAQTSSEGIVCDVDNDGADEAIRLAYGAAPEEGMVTNVALDIDGVEVAQGLDGAANQLKEESFELQAIKLPNGFIFLHVAGYCTDNTKMELDQVYRVENDAMFGHKADVVIDCNGKDCLMQGKGVSNATSKLVYLWGNEFVIRGICTTKTAGAIKYYVAYKCNDKGKLVLESDPHEAYATFKTGEDNYDYHGALARDVKVYRGIKCKKYETIKAGTKMEVIGVYPQGNDWLLQVQTKPYGKYKTVTVGYVKLTKSAIFEGVQNEPKFYV